MKIRFNNDREIRLAESLNASVELARKAVVEISKLESEIYYIDNNLLEYKSERKKDYNQRTAYRAELNKLRKQLGDVQSRISSATGKKKDMLVEAEKVVQENIKETEKSIERLSENIKLYDMWIERTSGLLELKKEARKSLVEKLEEQKLIIAEKSRMLQEMSGKDLYLAMILDGLSLETNKKGANLTLKDLKIETLDQAEQSEE